MRKFFILLSREVRAYFYSPLAYIVLFFFLVMTGFDFNAGVSLLNRSPQSITVVEAFFNTFLFWIVFLLMIPLITMRTFAEEFKMGTIETLMTAPVRDWQVVLSKFFGTMVFYIVLWLPSLAYFYIFSFINKTSAAHAFGAYEGSYLLLLLMGMYFISIGCLASALTSNQIVAAVITFCALLLLLFLPLLGTLSVSVSPFFRDLVGYFSVADHMADFSKGIIDSRPIVYYSSMTFLMLALTHYVFQSRKWRA